MYAKNKLKNVHVDINDGTNKEYVLIKRMSLFAYDLSENEKKLKPLKIEDDAVSKILITKRIKVEILGKRRKD